MIYCTKRIVPLSLSIIGIVLVQSINALAAQEEQAIPRLKLANESISEDGHIKIEWDMPVADAVVELQQANSDDFSDAIVIYRGPDNATFVSGLEDGKYHYRVRKIDGQWSDAVSVQVKHHSLKLALVLFLAGSVVFVLTVLVVVRGALTATTD